MTELGGAPFSMPYQNKIRMGGQRRIRTLKVMFLMWSYPTGRCKDFIKPSPKLDTAFKVQHALNMLTGK